MAPDVTAAAVWGEIALAVAGTALLVGWNVRRNRRPEPTVALAPWPGTGADLGMFVLAALAGGWLLAAAASWPLRHTHLALDTKNFLLGGVAFQGGLLLGMGLFHRFYRKLTSPAPAGAGVGFWVGLATFLIALPLIYPVDYACQIALPHLGIPVHEQTITQLFEGLPNVGWKVAFGLLACVLAPFNEELLFRAGVFRGLRVFLPRWAAVAGSAGLFAGAHWVLDPENGAASFLPLAVLGAVFALAYERTGRLRTTVIAHALFNINTLLCLAAGIK